jgi:2-keto-4-pentenoate hydratase/2-oxohepta-3-ene-1,7-dioic acid hydratase in catechol pathway
MQFLNFRTAADTPFRLGVKTQGGILDVGAAASKNGALPMTTDELIKAGDRKYTSAPALKAIRTLVEKAKSSELLQEETVEYGPCVLAPGKIICIGLNYRQHAAESGLAVPQTPVIFSKFNNSLAACGEDIPLATNAEQYDYEAELVAVIGKKVKFVPQENALEVVFGYCNGDDFSARDLQMRTAQWLLGKTPDKFMPIGPYLVTADEVGDPQTKPIRCWLNGEKRQDSNTSDMVFSVIELVSYISQYMTLEPGDLISTGTPQGVVLGMKEKNWVKPGDVIEVEVEGLGRLVNRAVAEAV